MLRIGTWALFMVFAGLGSAAAQTVASIQKLDNTWATGFNNGDAAAVAAMYAEDAYVLPPGRAMIKGRAAIESFWKQAAQQFGNAKLVAVDVAPLGPRAAREIGTVTLETKTQPPQQIVGKFVVVWRQLGGRWLLATDIWNSDK